nr:unnamed protein product [Digitaria exilis]
MTTTIAMMVATSTPGRTTRLNTSSPSVATGLDATPAFFLAIRAASLPSLPRRILQFLLEKDPSIRAEHLLIVKTCCCDVEDGFFSWVSSVAV